MRWRAPPPAAKTRTNETEETVAARADTFPHVVLRVFAATRGPAVDKVKMPRTTRAPMDEAWFRARYDADATNRAKQSWSDHLGWVRTFYEGKRFPPVPGWSDRERDLVAKAPSARDAIARVGRVLASEWAKDNSVRKVSTSDLQSWGKRFSDAARTADGLVAALGEVEAELQKRGVALA